MYISNAKFLLLHSLGTRLNPFGTNPQFGIDYWPKNAKLIQVEADYKRLNVTKNADVCIHGDAKKAAVEILRLLKGKGVSLGVCECLHSWRRQESCSGDIETAER